jgi:tRNA A-37 threonylcarbamoyl transferase component Bud32
VTDEDRLLAGRYRLSRELGRGGMGTVWLAEDTLLDRRVAVKKLRVPTGSDEEERARLYERTRREARSAARISHPGVIVVHDVVEEAGLPCIVMEYVPSRSLSDVLEEDGRLTPGEAARTGKAMASALRAAHAAGVLHRDVKPANVLLAEEQQRIVLTDFGIAAASGTTTLTRTGEFVGSVNYAAPERMQGGESSPAADAWALGATLYKAVEGVAPFARDNWVETAYAAASEPPRPMERAGALGELIEGLLEKDPEERLTLQQAEEWLAGNVGTVALPAQQQAAARVPAGAGAAREPMQQSPAGEPTAAGGELTEQEQSVQPVQPAPPDRAGRPARSTTRRALTWAVCAAVLGGLLAGGAWWMSKTNDPPGTPGGPSSPGPTKTGPGPLPPVADGYHRVRDGLGFSVDVPKGWVRRAQSGGQQVDYISPDRMTGLKISVLDFAGRSPLEHWRQLEKQVKTKSPGYRNLRMNETAYQGRDAAIWEYTWQGRARPFHAIDLGFGTEGQRHYAVYLSAPDAQWGRMKPHFDMATKTFRIKPPRPAGR